MGLETRLRAKATKEYNAGANIYTVLHPITKDSDPSSLTLNEAALKEYFLGSYFDEVKSTKGIGSTTNNSVTYDLDYAKRVYLAFGISLDSPTKMIELEEALTEYEVVEENRDDLELQDDLLKDTVKALVRANATALQIQSSFVRSSVVKGVITLELLAVYLKISFELLIADLALAVLIKAKLDLL